MGVGWWVKLEQDLVEWLALLSVLLDLAVLVPIIYLSYWLVCSSVRPSVGQV